VGNRFSQTVNGTTTSYSYNALDQLTSDGTNSYSYDGRGNLTAVTSSTSLVNYAYDAADRLTGVQSANGGTLQYTYDADGRRIQQTSNGLITNYLWDTQSPHGDVIQESDTAGTIVAAYTLGDNRLLAETQNGNTHFYLQDAQGSTRTLIDGAGNITDKYTYSAFGETQAHQGTTVNPYQYTGQRFDSQTGLYDLRARAYNPTLGRFLTRDTMTFGLTEVAQVDPYGYTAGDPVNGAVGEPCDGSHTNH
jgi:RHS repeat-associated protein